MQDAHDGMPAADLDAALNPHRAEQQVRAREHNLDVLGQRGVLLFGDESDDELADSGRRWTGSNRWWRRGAATPSPTRPTRPSPTIPRSSCPSGRPASRWRRTCAGSGTRRKP